MSEDAITNPDKHWVGSTVYELDFVTNWEQRGLGGPWRARHVTGHGDGVRIETYGRTPREAIGALHAGISQELLHG